MPFLLKRRSSTQYATLEPKQPKANPSAVLSFDKEHSALLVRGTGRSAKSFPLDERFNASGYGEISFALIPPAEGYNRFESPTDTSIELKYVQFDSDRSSTPFNVTIKDRVNPVKTLVFDPFSHFPISTKMNPKILKHTPAKGFSLIEVLIALALFAIASNVIGSAFINALLSRERNNDNSYRDIAIQTARKQLLLEKNIDDAEDGGSIETLELGEVDWYAEIIPTDMVDLFEVNLFIEFFDLKDDQSTNYNETLLLLRPTWSESDERSSLLQDKKEDLLDIRASELFD